MRMRHIYVQHDPDMHINLACTSTCTRCGAFASNLIILYQFYSRGPALRSTCKIQYLIINCNLIILIKYILMIRTLSMHMHMHIRKDIWLQIKGFANRN
jgi:hypothetical protein